MPTDRLVPRQVDLVPPKIVLGEEPSSMDARRPEMPRLTPEERGICTKMIAQHVAHLEQIPTADLSAAALRRLTLVAIELLGADPLGGEKLPILGNEHGAEPSERRNTPSQRQIRRG
jgi:hypothetical protein